MSGRGVANLRRQVIETLCLMVCCCVAATQASAGERIEAVSYEKFGAKGDGVTDDLAALVAAHAFANQHNRPVATRSGATYYLGGDAQSIAIETDTDFGEAKFIIDDTKVAKRQMPVFVVRSKLKSFKPGGMTTLKAGQSRIDIELAQPSLVIVENSAVKRFIRRGANRNDGSPQKDVFLVDRQGRVDAGTPILWDFDKITSAVAFPLDSETLTISGGHFTTIANQEESNYKYFARGISIRRSNVIVRGLRHRVTGEGEQGAPYGGFININNCANVKVIDTILHGRKTYRTIGSAGVSVSMGSYDLSVSQAVNISFIDCHQFDDINDRSRWGILGSNFCKNLLYERCHLSRFDAHQGVAGATIRDSKMGYMGINAIGSGTFLVQNSTICGHSFINLRSDYGSTWQGDFIIKDCVFVPAGGRSVSASLIGGSNDGQHDFGYECHMPARIVIENLHIEDSNHPAGYKGPAIFANFSPSFKDASYVEKYPYVKTREVVLRNVTTASGKPLRVSPNTHMFKDVIVTRE